MSLLRRFWNKIRHPTGYVGRDLEGNKFYERSNALVDGRPKRSVVYRRKGDMWDYIGGSKRLPVQWSAWLAHTRFHPPTLQELQLDFARQQRVRHNALLIEARDREESERRLQLEASSSSAAEAEAETVAAPAQADDESVRTSSPLAYSTPSSSESNPSSHTPTPTATPTQNKPSKPLPATGSDDYQPESWNPASRPRVRRGQ